MNFSELVLEALNLMLIGMVFVILFLGILVVLIPLLNKIIPEEPRPSQLKANQQPNNNDDNIIPVITAAVAQYRKNNN